MRPRLPISAIIAYSAGQWGWATLINILSITLVYFYLPPKEAGLPPLVTDSTFFYVLNVITVIAAGGRLFEALFCPIAAGWSDRAHFRGGRRLPFMAAAAFPAAMACACMYWPPDSSPSTLNIIWLVGVQATFSLAFVLYTIPHNALLIELGRDAHERLNLSVYISVAYALGVILGAQTPEIGKILQENLDVDKITGFRYAAAGLCGFAGMLMLAPSIFINEKKYSDAQPSAVPIGESFRATLSNVHFRKFAFSDLAYWSGLSIVETGFMYYMTVLLRKDETFVSKVMPIMLLSSFLLYPVVQILAKKISVKAMIQFAFCVFGVVFSLIFFLGKIPLDENIQVGAVVIIVGLPAAFLGILPNTIVAEISELETLETGVNREGMFFAVRGTLMKLGQTTGVLLFASMLPFGREPGNDFGVRVTGLIGVILMAIAFTLFFPYREKFIRKRISDLKSLRENSLET